MYLYGCFGQSFNRAVFTIPAGKMVVVFTIILALKRFFLLFRQMYTWVFYAALPHIKNYRRCQGGFYHPF